MWDITRANMANSNVHGVSQMIYARFLSMKIIWICLFITALSLMFWNVGRLMVKYVSEPTSLANVPDAAAFVAPDIHICNLHNFALSRLLYPSQSSLDALNFLQQQLNLVEKNYPMNSSIYDIRSSYFWSSISINALYLAGGEKIEQVLLEAYQPIYESIPLSQFQVVYNSDHLLCFRYQPNDTLFINSEDFVLLTLYLDSYHEKQLNNTFLGHYWRGYDFGSDHQQSTYPEGYVIYFTERGRYPYPDQPYVLISGGSLVNVNLRMTVRSRVNTRNSPCQVEEKYEEWQNPLLGGSSTMKYKVGAFGDCMERKLVERSIKTCGCYSHRSRVNGSIAREYPVCGNASRLSISSKTIIHQLQCTSRVRNDKDALNVDQSDCLNERQCNDIDYDVSWTSLEWPTWSSLNITINDTLLPAIDARSVEGSDIPGLLEYKNVIMRNNLSRDMQMVWTRENFARLIIRPGQVRGAILSESLSYDIAAFTSEVGGAMGFYMGLSVLAVCELLQIIHDWFLLYFIKIDLIEAEKEERARKESLPMQEWGVDDVSREGSFNAESNVTVEETVGPESSDPPADGEQSRVSVLHHPQIRRFTEPSAHHVRFPNDGDKAHSQLRIRKYALPSPYERRPPLPYSHDFQSDELNVRKISTPFWLATARQRRISSSVLNPAHVGDGFTRAGTVLEEPPVVAPEAVCSESIQTNAPC